VVLVLRWVYHLCAGNCIEITLGEKTLVSEIFQMFCDESDVSHIEIKNEFCSFDEIVIDKF